MTKFSLSESPYDIKRVLLCRDHAYLTHAEDCHQQGYHETYWAYMLYSHGTPCRRSNGDQYTSESYSTLYSTARRYTA